MVSRESHQVVSQNAVDTRVCLCEVASTAVVEVFRDLDEDLRGQTREARGPKARVSHFANSCAADAYFVVCCLQVAVLFVVLCALQFAMLSKE